MTDEQQFPGTPGIPESRDSARGPARGDGALGSTGEPGRDPDGMMRPVTPGDAAAFPGQGAASANGASAGERAWSGDGALTGDGVPARDGLPTADGVSAGEGPTARQGGAVGDRDGPAGGDEETARPPAARRRSFWRELPVLIVVALALALLIKTFAVQAFFIPSSSMENTLDIGDRVLVNKIVYHTRSIHRGDIVVFNGLDSWDPSVPQTAPSNPVRRAIDWVGSAFGVSAGEKDYIKRVVGVPGDHVKCCDAKGRMTVNGAPLSESSYLYPGNAPSATPFSVTVPPGRLWVMGDHRAVSYDSRQHLGDPGGGSIPENKIVGRAFLIVWPVNRFRILPIPSTYEQKALAAPGPVGQVARAAAGAAPAAPALLGLAGAVPLTVVQRRLRSLYARRRRRARGPRDGRGIHGGRGGTRSP